MIEMEIIAKLIISALLGMAIGLEREIHKKPAGLRTHSLVCMGAALFTTVSLSFQGLSVDVSRVAAGVVTGIGFLGAGMIFFARDKIRGLTTAAELWALAGVGLAVGIGLYSVAYVATIIIFLILAPGKFLEKKTFRKRK